MDLCKQWEPKMNLIGIMMAHVETQETVTTLSVTLTLLAKSGSTAAELYGYLHEKGSCGHSRLL